MESYRYHYLQRAEEQDFVNTMAYCLVICHEDLTVAVGDQVIHASAGDCCLYHGRQSLRFESPQGAAVSCLTFSERYGQLYLQPQLYQQPIFYDFFQLETGQEDALFFRSGGQAKLQKTLALLAEEAQQGQAVVVYHLLLVLLYQLHQVHQEILSITDSTMMPHRLAGAFLKYMEAHMADISLQSMAQAFGYHPTYFSKLCQELLKTSFSDKVRQLRFERACHLLAHSPLSISQIMVEVGFRDAGHFHRRFKAIYGCTPLTYRKQAARPTP